MSVQLRPKRSGSVGVAPTLGDLVDGEIAINSADKIIYQRRENTIVKIAGLGVRPGDPAGFTDSGFTLGNNQFSSNFYAAGLSLTWQMTDASGAVPVIDGGDYFRWGNSAATKNLRIPTGYLGIGANETGQALLVASGFTTDQIHTLPNKSGTYAMLDDTMGIDPQYISGFGHRTTATTVVINAGRAYVESVGQVVEYAGGTYTYPGTIPNNVTIHFYLHSSGTVDISVTGPGHPYFGTARSRSDSNARRYLFSVRSMPSGNQLYLQRGVSLGNAMDITFVNNTSAQNALLLNGTSTTPADVSAAAYAPADVTTDLNIRVYNDGTAGTVRLYSWSGSAFGVWSNVPTISELITYAVPCDATPKVQYDVAGAAGARAQIALLGYRIER